MRIIIAFGTRPEFIKLAPVVFEIRRHPEHFEPVLVATAQHRDMLDQMMDVFGLEPDIDLNLMTPNQTLGSLTGKVLKSLQGVFRKVRPGLLMIQGDTTTAMASALAAFYQEIPVAHIEAGLRTGDSRNPFPEEINRRIISLVADLHFAPTPAAGRNLRREGIRADRIFVTGNTVVDALRHMSAGLGKIPLPLIPGTNRKLILVTAHRRENFGQPLENICLALRDLHEKFEDIEIVYPVHPNPQVGPVTRKILGGLPRVHLIRPLDYLSFLRLMKESFMILTDSGGIQEEAPAFGKPVLVLRKVTERPEGVRAGASRIVPPGRRIIVREAARLLTRPDAYRRMARARNPYGDGQASRRIAAALEAFSRSKSEPGPA